MLKRIAAALLLIVLVLPLSAAGAEIPHSAAWQYFAAREAQWLGEAEVYPEAPLYYQTDYPDIPFSHGTVATSGCGITCLAMAATYLLDRTITPDQLALQFGDLQMNNVQRINHAIEALGLPLETSPRRWSQMRAALENGQLVILLVNGNSPFTDGQHMLLLTGITPEGRILVLDPYEPNYNRAELITGYTLGFQEKTLSKGFDGGWIFGKKQKEDAPDYAAAFRKLCFPNL